MPLPADLHVEYSSANRQYLLSAGGRPLRTFSTIAEVDRYLRDQGVESMDVPGVRHSKWGLRGVSIAILRGGGNLNMAKDETAKRIAWYNDAIPAAARDAHRKMMRGDYSGEPIYFYYKPNGLSVISASESDGHPEGYHLVTAELAPRNLEREQLVRWLLARTGRLELFPKWGLRGVSKPSQTYVLMIGRERYPVESLAAASALYSELRDDSGEGASTWPVGRFVGTDLHIAYNGKIFRGPWVPGQKPIYDPYNSDTDTRGLGNVEHDRRKAIAAWASTVGPRLTADATHGQLLAWLARVDPNGEWAFIIENQHMPPGSWRDDDDTDPRKMTIDEITVPTQDELWGTLEAMYEEELSAFRAPGGKSPWNLGAAPPGPASGFGQERTQDDYRRRIEWEQWASAQARAAGHEAVAQGHDMARADYIREYEKHKGSPASGNLREHSPRSPWGVMRDKPGSFSVVHVETSLPVKRRMKARAAKQLAAELTAQFPTIDPANQVEVTAVAEYMRSKGYL